MLEFEEVSYFRATARDVVDRRMATVGFHDRSSGLIDQLIDVDTLAYFNSGKSSPQVNVSPPTDGDSLKTRAVFYFCESLFLMFSYEIGQPNTLWVGVGIAAPTQVLPAGVYRDVSDLLENDIGSFSFHNERELVTVLARFFKSSFFCSSVATGGIKASFVAFLDSEYVRLKNSYADRLQERTVKQRIAEASIAFTAKEFGRVVSTLSGIEEERLPASCRRLLLIARRHAASGSVRQGQT